MMMMMVDAPLVRGLSYLPMMITMTGYNNSDGDYDDVISIAISHPINIISNIISKINHPLHSVHFNNYQSHFTHFNNYNHNHPLHSIHFLASVL